MNLLLDTCSLLWALTDPALLSPVARRALFKTDNAITVSTISFWEISLKASVGKLELSNASPGDFPGFVREAGWDILPLEAEIAATFDQLPRNHVHVDPFDRLLIWTAVSKHLVFVTRDRAVHHYEQHGLKVCW